MLPLGIEVYRYGNARTITVKTFSAGTRTPGEPGSSGSGGYRVMPHGVEAEQPRNGWDAVAAMRSQRAPGDQSALWAASADRYDLPESHEEMQLLGLLGYGMYPHRLGRVAGLFCDVLQGRSTAQEAERAASRVTAADVPSPYVAALVDAAGQIGFRGGRADDALLLARLLLAAVRASCGVGSARWVDASMCFVQCATNCVEGTHRRPIEAETLAGELLVHVRTEGNTALLSRVLSSCGQLYAAIAEYVPDASPDSLELLRRAREALSESADLRTGAERGRTLATLIGVVGAMRDRGAATTAELRGIAQHAAELTDAVDRPRQWFAVMRQLASLGGFAGFSEAAIADKLREVRSRHGPLVAAQCLLEALDSLRERGMQGAAADLLESMWDSLAVLELADEELRGEILHDAIHVLDRGIVSCTRRVDGMLAADRASIEHIASGVARAVCLAHLAVEARTPESVLPMLAEAQELARISPLHASAVAYASALTHYRASISTSVKDAFAFRCGLLAAIQFITVNQRRQASQGLTASLQASRRLASSLTRRGNEMRGMDAETELRAALDGSLRSAGWLDAVLGDPAREWLLEVGRVLSSLLDGGWPHQQELQLAHRLAFKGALSTAILSQPGPAPEPTELEELRLQVAALEAGGEQEVEAIAPAYGPPWEEMQLCAWLRGAEQRSGGTVGSQRRNVEAQYDERSLTRRLGGQNIHGSGGPWELASRDRLVATLAPRSVLVDVYLGRSGSGDYVCYTTVVSPARWVMYGNRHPSAEPVLFSDPADPDSQYLIDGLGALVSLVRRYVQEPSGARPVSRPGADALSLAATYVLGGLAENLAAMRAEGTDHLVIWPHGPLAYLPFHLLPVGQSVLADEWIVTVVPTLPTALAERPAAPDHPRAWCGIAASPLGGKAAGLPAEPSLWDHAQQLADIDAGSRLLPLGAATPGAVRDILECSQHAHLAAHGAATGHAPAFHCLYFDADGPGEGRLFAHDILGADLRGVDMVTLCACETALGRTDPAGNWRGLPFALLSAGARCVIATLWPTEADTAACFFGALYSRLRTGASPLDSFAHAQRHTREIYYRYRQWGAFTYIGSWR